MWRMRGGAHEAIIERYSYLADQGAKGELESWASTPTGRLALIIVLDQFSRSVWAGTPLAFAQDDRALDLCKEGLSNGHYDALDNVWQKSVFKLPLGHCECPAHIANLDLSVALGIQIAEDAPPQLHAFYRSAVQQPVKHRTVISTFGRFPHRNAALGRVSTPAEAEYVARGEFPHTSDIRAFGKDPN